MQSVKFTTSDEKAVIPTKGTPFAVGYDLTAISVKSKNGRLTMFNTHIQVQPPAGYYTEIVARSSLVKTGYVLANSVGIIDPDYRGDLLLALLKVDDTMPDLELPFCRCQLILRKYEDFTLEKVETLSETQRAEGGFGSTDKTDKTDNFQPNYISENARVYGTIYNDVRLHTALRNSGMSAMANTNL